MIVQLGARVAQEARQLAVEAAKQAGISLNAWVERALRAQAKVEGVPAGAPQPLAGQMAIDEVLPPTPEPDVDWKRFDPACRNVSYHWKQSPGNPCRFCGGEI